VPLLTAGVALNELREAGSVTELAQIVSTPPFPRLCPLLRDSFSFWNRGKVKQDTFIVLTTGYLKVI